MGIFDKSDNYFISHRGFQPLAPENSLPSFYYAGLLGQWAIETDVHIAKDGEIVCCHNASMEKYCDCMGKIREMTYPEIARFPIINGNRVGSFTEEERRLPRFSEYLAICRKFESVPFIELKTDDVEEVFAYMHKCGFSDDEVVISSASLSSLVDSRAISKNAFVHWIFGNEDGLDTLMGLGNAGLSWRIDDPFECTEDKIALAHDRGLRVCLRAADNIRNLKQMKRLGLDYFPTNTMHKEFLRG